VDLLSKMLQFDPTRRITVEQALAHPWLASLHDPASEPSTPDVFKFDFEDDAALDDAALKGLVMEEMAHYPSSQAQQQ
jgi:serine/threonine protein kinase